MNSPVPPITQEPNIPFHHKARFSCLVESEASGVSTQIHNLINASSACWPFFHEWPVTEVGEKYTIKTLPFCSVVWNQVIHLQKSLWSFCPVENLLFWCSLGWLTQTTVEINWKMLNVEPKTVGDYKDWLIGVVFRSALNRRFTKISRRKDPPYFGCSAAEVELVCPVKAVQISSSCKEKNILEALKSVLTEVCIYDHVCGYVLPWLVESLPDTFHSRLQGLGYMSSLSAKYQ